MCTTHSRSPLFGGIVQPWLLLRFVISRHEVHAPAAVPATVAATLQAIVALHAHPLVESQKCDTEAALLPTSAVIKYVVRGSSVEDSCRVVEAARRFRQGHVPLSCLLYNIDNPYSCIAPAERKTWLRILYV